VRVLVTGANGFVGGFAVDALRARGDEVIAAGHGAPGLLPLDVRDPLNVRGVIDLAQADAIVHLAAQAFVPQSISDPLATIDINAMGTARLLEAVRAARDAGGTNPRVLIVSTAEVYGAQPPAAFPLRESTPPAPANPYAASKLAAEAFGIASVHAYGLDVIIVRSFNHIGPGQDDRFVVASFAAQLAKIARGGPAEMLIGNLSAERDFLDVRDVVRAYVALLERGERGQIYNVCSGVAVPIRDVLRMLVTTARVAVEIREDPARMRESDTPLFVGDASKLRAATGWAPQIALETSLRDTYRAAFERAA